jgi:hypothetical protein
MEVEVYAKGYYLIGGMPQYYRIFWGIITSVQKSWSNGVTSVVLSAKDILMWWERTVTTINPAYINGSGSSAGGYQLFQNQFAGQNPYVTIIQLGRDSMGDFLLTTGSLNLFLPERGAESGVVGSYAKDIMAYWQLKFANIQSNLVLFGTSGQAYTFSGELGTVSPIQVADAIFKSEYEKLQNNQTTSVLFLNRKQQQTFKKELSRAGDLEMFQNEYQNKLSLALQARDQLGFEFYCDTTGDIIFKPPFYNLNVLPNKPVSWVQDIDIIDDSIVDSEAEVVTHVYSSGNAFQQDFDPGISDEVTTPKTGVYDFHLLRRYGFRSASLQLEWAGNPRKLFFYLLDWMDRINAKRQSGTVTIPMRPELRMGFPVWVPKYDSFFYIQGIAHQYSPGGQATTTLTLTAKRSKFIAPKNIGEIKKTGKTTKVQKTNENGAVIGNSEDETYKVTFPGTVGTISGLSQQDSSSGTPSNIRDPKTGKLLGYPNVVMVYRSAIDGTVLARILETQGKSASKNPGAKQGKQPNKVQEGLSSGVNNARNDVLRMAIQGNKDALIERVRMHRYEAGMTNTGAYDYAHDVDRSFKEMALVPASSITWGSGTDGGPDDPDNKIWNQVNGQINPLDASGTAPSSGAVSIPDAKARKAIQDSQVSLAQVNLTDAKASFDKAYKAKTAADKALAGARKQAGTNVPADGTGDANIEALYAATVTADTALSIEQANLTFYQTEFNQAKSNTGNFRVLPSLNILIRPVSDEYGFEVIGHNRYGRGAFIDRGGIQLSDNDKIVNQLSIQFAPTGGALTDASSFTNADPNSVNFASVFEKMMPDDYVTGASFTGTTGNAVSNVQTTSAQTYTNLINANKGTGLYIEADATRRSKTLAELTPTINVFENSKGVNAFPNCFCGISKPGWVTLLPQELIAKIIGSTGSLMYGTQENISSSIMNQAQTELNNLTSPESLGQQQVSTPAQQQVTNQKINLYDSILQRGSTPVNQQLITGNVPSNSFFTALNEYLINLFNTNLSSNTIREEAYTAANLGIISPVDISSQEQDNVLGTPGGALFDRAALGDPVALKALQDNVANKNFGLTDAAIKNFKPTVKTQQQQLASKSAAQVQPIQNPTLGSVINPTLFNSAGETQFTYRDGTPGKSISGG